MGFRRFMHLNQSGNSIQSIKQKMRIELIAKHFKLCLARNGFSLKALYLFRLSIRGQFENGLVFILSGCSKTGRIPKPSS